MFPQTRSRKPLRPLRPGTTPLAELARLPRAPGSKLPADGPLGTGGLLALMREWREHLTEDVEVLLPIDQFEELVTLGKEVGKDTAEQKEFQEELAGVLRSGESRLHLLVTLRGDYAPDLASGPLKEWWRGEALFPVPALSPVELRQIIQLPAALVALDFANPDEIDSLVAEVAQTPNPLPILSCALRELYEHYVESNDGSRSLKLPEDFAQSGAVAGSLGRSGNGLRDGLPDEFHREVLDHVLLRFVSFEGGRAARRQVLKSELDYASPADAACGKITSRLVERRLLTTGQSDSETPCWELCHDRLLVGWGHYRRLIQEKQETIILQRRLAADMATGERKGPDGESTRTGRGPFLSRFFSGTGEEKNLWDGDPRLDQVSAVLKTPLPWLNRAEVQFVRCSQETRERKRKRWRNGIIATGVVLTLLAITATAFGIRSGIASGEAKKQAAEAEKQTGIAKNAANDSRIAAEKADKSATEARTAETKTLKQLAQSQYREAYRMLELGNLNGAASLFLKSHENDPDFLAPIDQLAHLCRSTRLLALADRPTRADPSLLKNRDWTGFMFESSIPFLHERPDGGIDFYAPPHLISTGPQSSGPIFKSAPSIPILKEGQFNFEAEVTETSKNDWNITPVPTGEDAPKAEEMEEEEAQLEQDEAPHGDDIDSLKGRPLFGMAAIAPNRKLVIVAGGIDPQRSNAREEDADPLFLREPPKFYLTLLGLPDLQVLGSLKIDAASPPAGYDGEINIEINSLGWKSDSREFVVAWKDNVLNSLRIDIYTPTEEPPANQGDEPWIIRRQASSCFRGITLPLQYYQSDPIAVVRDKGFANVIRHDFGLSEAIADRDRQLEKVNQGLTSYGAEDKIHKWDSGYFDPLRRLPPPEIPDPTSSRSARFNTGGEILVKDSASGALVSAFAGAYREGEGGRDPRGLAWTADSRYLAAIYHSGGGDTTYTWFFEPNSGLPAFEKDFFGVYYPTWNAGCNHIWGYNHRMNSLDFGGCFYSVIPAAADGNRFTSLDRFNRLVNPWSVESSGALIHTDRILDSTRQVESPLRELNALWKKSLGNPRDLVLLEVEESEPPPKVHHGAESNDLRTEAVAGYFQSIFGDEPPPPITVATESSWEALAAEQGLPLEFLCELNNITYIPDSKLAAGTPIRTIGDKTKARDIARLFDSIALIRVAGTVSVKSLQEKFSPPGRWKVFPEPDENRTSTLQVINHWNREQSEVEHDFIVVIRDASPSATPAHKALEDALKSPRNGTPVLPSEPCLTLLHLSSETAVAGLLAEHSMSLARFNQLNATAWETSTVLPAGMDVFVLP
jgi:hypothetical protein